jgi:hypothetical protein
MFFHPDAPFSRMPLTDKLTRNANEATIGGGSRAALEPAHSAFKRPWAE